MSDKSLYERIGGYDGVVAVAGNLLPRLQGDERLGRFWQNRGDDGIAREAQLLIDYLSASAGGPVLYTGRDMKTSHAGMGIDGADWDAFIGHVTATFDHFGVGDPERGELMGFIGSLADDVRDS